MALVERKLRVAIQVVPNQTNQPQTIAETDTPNITLDGHRASLRVQNASGIAGSRAELAIWGLSQSLQDQLSTLGQVIQLIGRNTITITAGDTVNGFSVVFVGIIVRSYPTLSGAPDVPFRFELNSEAAGLVIPFPASTYKGAVSAVTVLQAIAQQSGWKFENSGVSESITVSNPYLSSNATVQVRKICDAVQIQHILENNVLAIWPRYGLRKGFGKPLVSKNSGMIGFPEYVPGGIKVATLFDPKIRIGGEIEVQSELKRASGTWRVLAVDLALDQLIPKGQWMTTALCYNPNFPTPFPR